MINALLAVRVGLNHRLSKEFWSTTLDGVKGEEILRRAVLNQFLPVRRVLISSSCTLHRAQHHRTVVLV